MRNVNDLLANESLEFRERVKAKSDLMLLELNLSEIRDQAAKTQREMAEVIGIKQPTLAKMEKVGQDIKLSTLKRYIESAGCKMRIEVDFPDGVRKSFAV